MWLKDLLEDNFLPYLILSYIEGIIMLLIIHKFSIHKPVNLIRNLVVLFLSFTFLYVILNNQDNSIALYFLTTLALLMHIRNTYREKLLNTFIISMFVQIFSLSVPFIIMLLYQMLYNDILKSPYFGMYVDLSALGVTLILFLNKKLDNFAILVSSRVPVKLTIIIGYVVTLVFLTSWKLDYETLMGNYALIGTLFIVVIVFMSESLKSHLDEAAKEQELLVYRNYLPVIEEMVSTLRSKQHEYDKHIQSLALMPLQYEDYHSLRDAMKAYISELEPDNALIQQLKIDKKTIAGYLYYQINKGREQNINVSISINQNKIQTKAKDSELIEVLGILIDNAYEAVTENDNDVQIIIDSINNRMLITVLNAHPYLNLNTVNSMYNKGFSTKKNPQSRGFGLYNINLIVKKHKGALYTVNKLLNDRNYVSITVEI